MDPFTLQDRVALCDAAREVSTSGLVVGSAGNVSVRSGEHLLVTPMGSRLPAIEPRDCVCVALADGAVDPGHARPTRPSSETPLHRLVYAAAPDAVAIVHTHSHFATALSALVDELPAVHYVASAFGGPVRVAPYATYGSDALAEAVAAALDGRTAALMANHGAVALGRSAAHAVEQAQQLEWWASVYWHARVFGEPAILSDAQLDEVSAQHRALRYSEAATDTR
ncbi:MAG TPA: class II aldolase/adducin family protein [Baekduia sp.]|uniref:class II aldolase/adducin family protein n=1 Tax=Baekduia sp. TaxID=2600305 RepID=UPI002D792929|nr:class II aldolase/adducin family protein [Baekduia sp.]HET6508141.1 class II aldolase/adducin family protein [Baekduia sp.]